MQERSIETQVGTDIIVWRLYIQRTDHYLLQAGFFGTEPTLMVRALEMLQEEGKCAFIDGDTPEDLGVKFISLWWEKDSWHEAVKWESDHKFDEIELIDSQQSMNDYDDLSLD